MSSTGKDKGQDVSSLGDIEGRSISRSKNLRTKAYCLFLKTETHEAIMRRPAAVVTKCSVAALIQRRESSTGKTSRRGDKGACPIWVLLQRTVREGQELG